MKLPAAVNDADMRAREMMFYKGTYYVCTRFYYIYKSGYFPRLRDYLPASQKKN